MGGGQGNLLSYCEISKVDFLDMVEIRLLITHAYSRAQKTCNFNISFTASKDISNCGKR